MNRSGLFFAAAICGVIFRLMFLLDWRAAAAFAFTMLIWSLWLIEEAIRGKA